MGEWGVVDDVENGLEHLRDAANMADRLMAGWAYWDLEYGGGFAFLNADRSEKPKINELIRTYPQRIGGVPEAYGYDPNTRTFTLEFTPVATVTAPTEIYIPAKRVYPDGWEMTIDGAPVGDALAWDGEREVASVTIAANGRSHTVSLKPR